ncbi:MAG: precorrin-2/cobalt-factor-2 C20-methyltransferase [Paracoccaceae bacterium]|jgi:precorrin-2/cobalt-factor-2 C20-methyltransferase
MATTDASHTMEPSETMTGTLYGIGVGPGDPELMTLKAARLIGGADVIAYPTLAGGESFARSIAADLIKHSAREIRIDVPMTTARIPAQDAYDIGAAEIATVLSAGQDVICLCEGDPFFYGSFMYLFARLSGKFTVEIVPGVSSLTACAARAAVPLAARNEVMTILPGPLPDSELSDRIDAADSIVLMKVGRHLGRLRAILEQKGLAQNAHYIERATLGTERVLPLSQAPDPAPYFSMILVTKGADPWL